MAVINSGRCWHCLETGHWANRCPLLDLPEDRSHHLERIEHIKARFTDGKIGPLTKRRMIEKENSLWDQRQKAMAKK